MQLNVHGILVVNDIAHVGQRSVQQSLLGVQGTLNGLGLLTRKTPLISTGSAALAGRLRRFQLQRLWAGTGVVQRFHFVHEEVTHARQVDFGPRLQVRAAGVTVQDNGAVTFFRFLNVLLGCDVFVTIGQDVGMSVAPHQRTKFDSRQKQT